MYCSPYACISQVEASEGNHNTCNCMNGVSSTRRASETAAETHRPEENEFDEVNTFAVLHHRFDGHL